MRLRRTAPFEDEDDAACRVCGRLTELTFEHLPPAASGNQQRVEMLGIESWLRRHEEGASERGMISQRGSGAYTLCDACNSRAGARYVPEFLKWMEAGYRMLSELGDSLEDVDNNLEPQYLHVKLERIRPARFLKQVVTMLLALAAPGFPPRNLALMEFAQDPGWVGLPPSYQLYLVLYAGGSVARYNGGAAVLRAGGEPQRIGSTFALELADPPFAYVLSVDESAPAVECGNISSFADLGIDQKADLEIDLRIGFGHTALPLDYRSLAMLERDTQTNIAATL